MKRLVSALMIVMCAVTLFAQRTIHVHIKVNTPNATITFQPLEFLSYEECIYRYFEQPLYIENGELMLELPVGSLASNPIAYTIESPGFKPKKGSFTYGLDATVDDILQEDDGTPAFDPTKEGSSIGLWHQADDVKKWIKNTERCAKAGSVFDMYQLGDYYRGSRYDKAWKKKEALYWYAQAAKRGYRLAIVYFYKIQGDEDKADYYRDYHDFD